MLKQCSNCKRRIKINEVCECQKAKKKETHNKASKKYRDENKDHIKMIENAKWKRLRKLIIERDGGYCQRCFIKYNTFTVDKLEVHHIKPRIKYPELVYDDKNLVCICKSCNITLGVQEYLDFNYEIPDIDYHIK